MKKLKSQSGRSMVEMLGVLAIIGVLSVGGIAGYSLSMRRHRANQVVDLVSKVALVSYSQCQQKILNGESLSSNSCYYSDDTSSVEFEHAGVGSLPAGVTFIGTRAVFPHADGKGDAVEMSTRFDDDKLCQAVAAITGSRCNDGSVIIEVRHN